LTRNLTILIAEDNEADFHLLELALRKNDIQNPIQLCRDGQEAIEYLQGAGAFSDRAKFPFPSVLFLDIKMPRKCGLEVLEWLKAHPKCSVIPVMVLTASRMESDVKKAYELGANAYMVKPSAFGDLVSLIGTACKFWSLCEKPPVPERCID
jgi:CheY-like chemotaxis protein